ncbi:hypothetical protein [Mobilicoccus caccae]|uniref:DUF3263 domain-containing protein n=1 Tax=Mobilicoccus caccae TaxID=1859295 RepID=A0ABQ6IP82_9MICO|nr:hypothetical protein [Mobilicoccus caccae]GMA39058.1 hypothetical protein GCM10025883_11030 [Mobilicoccus caccae]
MDITTDVTTHEGNIDQRNMSAGERFDLACVLRDAWWDCHGAFVSEVVDVTEIGLRPASLFALAQDLQEAGYPAHAGAVRAAAMPTRPRTDTVDRASNWRVRAHSAAAAAVER